MTSVSLSPITICWLFLLALIDDFSCMVDLTRIKWGSLLIYLLGITSTAHKKGGCLSISFRVSTSKYDIQSLQYAQQHTIHLRTCMACRLSIANQTIHRLCLCVYSSSALIMPHDAGPAMLLFALLLPSPIVAFSQVLTYDKRNCILADDENGIEGRARQTYHTCVTHQPSYNRCSWRYTHIIMLKVENERNIIDLRYNNNRVKILKRKFYDNTMIDD